MMTNCNDPRKRCGQIVPSNCVPYEGVKPDFVESVDWPCDVNVTDVVQLTTDKIDGILEDGDLKGLNKRCLTFDPATVTLKELEQVEIDKICALDAQLTALQTSVDNLNVGAELVTLNLGGMTPVTNPCSVTTNQYTLYYILSTLVTNINLIKTTLGI